jgi:hypothetical protein
MINRKVISVKGELYLVYRQLKDESKWDVDILKKLWNCTHAFRNDGILYMCREIETINYQEL